MRKIVSMLGDKQIDDSNICIDAIKRPQASPHAEQNDLKHEHWAVYKARMESAVAACKKQYDKVCAANMCLIYICI